MNEENEENEELSAIARKVAAYVSAKDDKFGLDPLLVIAIIGLIINISRFIYECRKNKTREQLFNEIKNPSWTYKFLLSMNIRKQWKNKNDRNNIYQSMLEVSKGLSQEELNCIFDKVEKKK